ncbi:MAG: Hsp20/alpha crystallin family protein [Deltaproteobacteria bacterium]|nr:Hsp20/alpha crystallin family protein [Deltaproteobacteria bacterium]
MLPRSYRSVPGSWDSLFGREYMPNFYANGSFKSVPAVNIMEDDDGYSIEVAAPGLGKKDFNINLENDVLTISSERENEVEENESTTRRREFSYNSFKRSFTLPDSIDTEKIKASHKDGILYVALPKREEAKVQPTRQITIS